MVQPDEINQIKREKSDPSADFDIVNLTYDLEEFTIASNDIKSFTLEYPKQYEIVPGISDAYDYDVVDDNVYGITPRVTGFNGNFCEVTFGNLKAGSATVSASVKLTLTIPKQ